jgi:hypothetical protein
MKTEHIMYSPEDNAFIFNCPHCDQITQVLKPEINCCIFRHGVYKNNFEPIDPHMSKEMCESLVEKDVIFGCAKPFRLLPGTPPSIEKCDYI